jgi:hypothetical protein
MTPSIKTICGLLIFSVSLALLSCTSEDPGPVQDYEKIFSELDFDRLEMGSGFHITVEQSANFSVRAEGDRRNLNDLEVYKSGSTLIVKFDDNANRHHTTYITITMPELVGVNFSGGSNARVSGFESVDQLHVNLSGGSVCQLKAGYADVDINLSGASKLRMEGLGDEFTADISGASELTAFEYPVRLASVKVTGASRGKVTVTDELDVIASGASHLLYRGSPSLSSDVSGASSIRQD